MWANQPLMSIVGSRCANKMILWQGTTSWLHGSSRSSGFIEFHNDPMLCLMRHVFEQQIGETDTMVQRLTLHDYI